jgi:hypothetical protein
MDRCSDVVPGGGVRTMSQQMLGQGGFFRERCRTTVTVEGGMCLRVCLQVRGKTTLLCKHLAQSGGQQRSNRSETTGSCTVIAIDGLDLGALCAHER